MNIKVVKYSNKYKILAEEDKIYKEKCDKEAVVEE